MLNLKVPMLFLVFFFRLDDGNIDMYCNSKMFLVDVDKCVVPSYTKLN